MSKNEQKKVSRIKTKKKNWYKILATAIFGKKEIGESYLSSPEQAVGRSLKINLKDLTGNMRDQNAYISFKISKWQSNTLETIHTGYELMPASVKRMVKKNCNRLDDYFIFKTKDNQTVEVKTLMLTLKKISRSTRTRLRDLLKGVLAQEFKNNNLDIIFNNITAYKIQPVAKKQLAKVYPLRELAIRKLSLIVPEAQVTKPKTETNPSILNPPLEENKSSAMEEKTAQVESVESH